MSRRKESIKDPHFFKNRTSKRAVRIDSRFKDLTRKKKEEIRQLIQDFKKNRIIDNFREENSSQRAINFKIYIVEKVIRLSFIIWTDNRRKSDDWIKSHFAKFVLGLNEDIENLRNRILRYLEGIRKGHTTECLVNLALESLKKTRKIHYFYKTGKAKDEKGKDFIILVLKEGKLFGIPLQAKSSYEALMEHEKRFPKIPGIFWESTGNLEKDLMVIKEKIIKVIRKYKEGKTIFV